jgi:syndetin
LQHIEERISSIFREEDHLEDISADSLINYRQKLLTCFPLFLLNNIFQGISQLFGIFYHYIYETFGHHDKSQSGKPLPDCQSCTAFLLTKKIRIHVFWHLLLIIYVITFLKCLVILVLYPARLKSALSKITQDSDQWIKPQNVSYSPSSSLSMNSTFTQMDVMPTAPPSSMFTSYGLKVCWFT